MSDFRMNKKMDRRTLIFSKNLVTSFLNGSVNVYIKLKSFSMLAILPLLHSFLLMAVNESVDMYFIFRFEPLNFLSLGLSRTLKEYLYKYLCDPQKNLDRSKIPIVKA